MTTISKRLQLLRGEKSRRSFAELLGIPASTLKNYEQGDTSPPLETLELVCEKLCISRRWLMLGEGSMNAEDIAPSLSPQQADGVDELKNRIAELEADNRRLEVELLAEKKITSVYQETLEALKAFALKGGAGITDVPVSVPSAPSINLTSDE